MLERLYEYEGLRIVSGVRKRRVDTPWKGQNARGGRRKPLRIVAGRRRCRVGVVRISTIAGRAAVIDAVWGRQKAGKACQRPSFGWSAHFSAKTSERPPTVSTTIGVSSTSAVAAVAAPAVVVASWWWTSPAAACVPIGRRGALPAIAGNVDVSLAPGRRQWGRGATPLASTAIPSAVCSMQDPSAGVSPAVRQLMKQASQPRSLAHHRPWDFEVAWAGHSHPVRPLREGSHPPCGPRRAAAGFFVLLPLLLPFPRLHHHHHPIRLLWRGRGCARCMTSLPHSLCISSILVQCQSEQ